MPMSFFSTGCRFCRVRGRLIQSLFVRCGAIIRLKEWTALVYAICFLLGCSETFFVQAGRGEDPGPVVSESEEELLPVEPAPPEPWPVFKPIDLGSQFEQEASFVVQTTDMDVPDRGRGALFVVRSEGGEVPTDPSAFVIQPEEGGVPTDQASFAIQSEGGEIPTDPSAFVIQPEKGGVPTDQASFAIQSEGGEVPTDPATFVIQPEEGGVPTDLAIFVIQPESSSFQEAETVAFIEDDSGLKTIFFRIDSVRLSENDKKTLDAGIQWLKDNPHIIRVQLEGHCDSTGSKEYNKDLGLRRAEAVKEYLVSNGIDEERLELISYGEENPFNRPDDQNRRVDFIPIYSETL